LSRSTVLEPVLRSMLCFCLSAEPGCGFAVTDISSQIYSGYNIHDIMAQASLSAHWGSDMHIFFLISCGDESSYTFEAGSNKPPQQEEPGPNPPDIPDAESTETTFYKDVRPIFDRTCNQCHWEEGRSFNMIEPDLPLVWADIIARDVRDGGKPPPTPNPECADYIGGDWHVTEEDMLTLETWVAEGAQIGDEADSSTYTAWESIGPFDMNLLPENFNIPGTEGYICFHYPLNEVAGSSLTGLQFTTNNEEYIHHSIVYLADSDWSPETNPQVGFDCAYSGTPNWDMIAGWRPGAPPVEFPEGAGVPVSSAQYLVQQVYYTPPVGVTEEVVVKPLDFYWGLNFSSQATKSVDASTTVNTDFIIPADETDHSEVDTLTWSGPSTTLIGLLPRTHLLGTGVYVSLQQADGVQCLLEQAGYDFGMPHNIMFLEPFTLEPGDQITYECRWDNSEENDRQMRHPPVDVLGGHGFEQAVCSVSLLTIPND
jgi:hypothetical protein